MIDLSHSEEIYTVSRLNREARYLLENHFPTLWVEGEISGFKAHTSGHWYFSLKDEAAQIRCALFRPANRVLGFLPKDGMHVLVKVRVSLYENRGDYQLIAEHMEEIGEGKLRQAFEALKKRLAEAGYFDASRKKLLPLFPRSIGVITSPTGAAIQDILSVLKRRYRIAPVMLYPTLVQGEGAAENIMERLQQANRRLECDVLILARGGGSLEDLWCFNDERVAKAIYESQIPIVSAIGHEIDFTIADFVADLRAATPTAAAELITPDQIKLADDLDEDEKYFIRLMTQKIAQTRENLHWIEKNLQQQHPARKLQEQAQQLDYFEMNLVRLQEKHIADLKTKLHIIAAKMNALSPLATLQRGFSITKLVKNNTILYNADNANIGDKIHIRLMQGNLECTVDGKS